MKKLKATLIYIAAFLFAVVMIRMYIHPADELAILNNQHEHEYVKVKSKRLQKLLRIEKNCKSMVKP